MQILTLIILLLLSAFFSSSETALTSVSTLRVRSLAAKGNEKAKVLYDLINQKDELIGAILFGNNLVNIGASSIATSLAISYFGNTGVGIATGVMTLLILVFSEITPKSLAIKYAESYSLSIAKIFSLIVKVLNPIVKLLMLTTNLILKVFGQKTSSSEVFVTKEELKTIIDVGHDEGVIQNEEKNMLKNVFELSNTRVDDVMTPRVDLVAFELNTSFDEVMQTLNEENFSKIPVYKDSIDDIQGIFYAKDLLFFDKKKSNFHLKDYIKEPFHVFEFENSKTVFEKLRKRNLPIAIVLDEFGGFAGIVTIEDLIEEIVGNIEDSYDDQEEMIIFINQNTFLVNGSLRIDMFNEYFETSIHSKDFDTIGGFLLGEYLLKKDRENLYEGATKVIKDIKFEVFDIENNKIEKLKVYINSK
ncbi:MAG: HlyC/CorC family transporter [Clostridia bacterium]